MSTRFVFIAKPELFASSALPSRYHKYFRSLISYTFPNDINIDLSVLTDFAKLTYIADQRGEMGKHFFEGKAPITTDFFDSWWTIELSHDEQDGELRVSDEKPAADVLDRLDKKERDLILSMQSDDVRTELKKLLEKDDRPHGPAAAGLLYGETPYFKPFPEPATVFAQDLETHLKYLLPLATVSLNDVNPAWNGSIHFVQPIEPHNGVIGESTTQHHSSLCKENWVGYRVDEFGRYTFAADWDYFLLSNLDTRKDIQLTTSEGKQLRNHYDEARWSYEKKREHFQRFHGIHPSYSLEEYGDYRDRDRLELVNQLGGKPGWGNWSNTRHWPLSEHPRDDDEIEDKYAATTYPLPQAEDGTDFSYIGWLHSFVYVATNDCALQLFYHSELRLALTTFDWS